MEDELLELYSQIHATGCFRCSTSELATNAYNDNSDECIDLCSLKYQTAQEWSEFFISSPEKDSIFNIDQGCGNALITILNSLTRTGALTFSELVHFANNLVYDDRTDTCYAYDVRDVHKRRLELIDGENCESFNCFDCAYTAGYCQWNNST